MNKICQQKGFVIDIWQSSVIQNLDDIVELLSGERNGALYEITKSEENLEGVEIEASSSSSSLSNPPKKLLENLIELNCNDAKVTQRDLEKLGIPEGGLAKASKDQQAAVKNLEASLTSYATKLKQIPLPEDSTEVPIMSHEGIQLIESSSLCSTTRINVTEISIEEIVDVIVQSVLKVHGPIGWMSSLSNNDIPITTLETIEEFNTNNDNKIPIVISNDEDEYMKINNGIMSVLSIQEKELLLSKTDELQKFLNVTVLPYVAQGLINIVRERQEDPIMYLADYLEQQSLLLESESEQQAKKEFDQLLNDALNITI